MHTAPESAEHNFPVASPARRGPYARPSVSPVRRTSDLGPSLGMGRIRGPKRTPGSRRREVPCGIRSAPGPPGAVRAAASGSPRLLGERSAWEARSRQRPRAARAGTAAAPPPRPFPRSGQTPAGAVPDEGRESAGSSRGAPSAPSRWAPEPLRTCVQLPTASGSLDFRRRTAHISSRAAL